MDGSHSLLFDQTAVWHSDAARGPSTPSFDHLVGECEEGRWHRKAERLGSLKIDDQLVLSRGLHGQIAGLFSLEDTVDVGGRTPKDLGHLGAVGHQTAARGKEPKWVDCRH